jgi:hypothetical protein
MKTTIESYQNQSQKQSKAQLTKRLNRLNLLQNYSFRLAKRGKLSFDGFKRCMKRIEALIIPLHDLRMIPETEINTLNELIPVTPINQIEATQNKIDSLQIQIEKIQKKRDRRLTFFNYTAFLFDTNRIDSEIYFDKGYYIRRKTKNEILKRVHALLINEQKILIGEYKLLVA